MKLADEAECGSDKDAVMVVGAVKMLRTYLLESRKESSDDAKSE